MDIFMESVMHYLGLKMGSEFTQDTCRCLVLLVPIYQAVDDQRMEEITVNTINNTISIEILVMSLIKSLKYLCY